MKVFPTNIPDVLRIEPTVFGDERGFFFESFNQKRWKELTGLTSNFVQDNHSRSSRNVLRGIHYQIKQPQGKLVRVIIGEVFDIAVDLRKSSPWFGRWTGARLSAENKHLFWVPEGFGHAFLVLSEYAEFVYRATDFYAPEHERAILWNDPELAIDWPIDEKPLLSDKDCDATRLKNADLYP